MRSLVAAAIMLVYAACIGQSTNPTPDAAGPVADAIIDSRTSTCDVLQQDCDDPSHGCLWTGADTEGQCHELGGLQGIGTHDVGQSCNAHALCKPGLACLTIEGGHDASIAMGECRALCLLSAPSCPACTPIDNTVGYCP